MIKILQVVGSLDRGGTEAFIMNVFRNIDRNRYMFDFLIFTDSKEGHYDEIKAMGATIFSLPARRDGFLFHVRSLSVFFSQHAKEYNAIHYNACSLTSILPLYFAKKHKIPIRIIHSHNSGWKGVHNLILHLFNRLFISNIANVYLACSQKAAKWSFSYTPALKKCKIINNVIDIYEFEYNTIIREKIRTEYNLQDKFVIGHVGRLSSQKNHRFLIEIFHEIQKMNSDAILLLIGNGDLESDIRKMVSEKNLTNHVLFLGVRDNVNQFMQAMDCFVFPSIYEGLGIVLIEAQTSGLPCFVSDVVPQEAKVTDLLKYISLSQTPYYWAKQIIELTNISIRNDQKEKIIAANYSITHTVQEITEIYGSLLPIGKKRVCY